MQAPFRHHASRFFVTASACLAIATFAIAAPPPAATPGSSKAAAPVAAPAADDVKGEAKVDLKLLPSGASEKIRVFNPQQLKLTEKKPASVKKAPELSAPAYGEIRFGGKAYPFAVDEPKVGEAKLYVDSNGNGDLTDDSETTWTKQTYQAQDGTDLTKYAGTFQLPLKAGDKDEPVTLSAYRFDKKDPQRQQLKNMFLYYSDYALEGDITLAGAKYHALLTDMSATGSFGGGKKAAGGAGASGPHKLLIDINGDGRFAPRGEVFDSSKPFNIKGTTWTITPSDSGPTPIQIAKSDQKVPEIALPPNHGVGQKVTPFTAKRMDGKTVNFPSDYKGHIVMLDFWATWCGPCMGEVDGLVSAYNEYRPKGVEILGISLDQANAAKQVKSVTAEKGMTWPQVYDGKYWKAAVAEKYGIQSIPAAFLVDGDTGEILAAGDSLRGENLAETLKEAVEKKGTTGVAQTAKAEEPKQAEAKEEKKSEPAAKPAKPAAPDEKPPF